MKQIRLTRPRSRHATPRPDWLGFDPDNAEVLPAKGLFDLAGGTDGRPSGAPRRQTRPRSGDDPA